MSRSLVLSNGRLFINFDDSLRIRDIYFPWLGIENHAEGHPFRWGVWLDGALHCGYPRARRERSRAQRAPLPAPRPTVAGRFAEAADEVRNEAVGEQLAVQTPTGGMARYRRDTYHATGDDWDRAPGNPWFAAQAWKARWELARTETRAELEAALEPLRWCVDRALSAGLLPEQLDPWTGAPLSVTPLTWSHAAFVSAVHDYLDRRDELERCPTCGAPATAATLAHSDERALR